MTEREQVEDKAGSRKFAGGSREIGLTEERTRPGQSKRAAAFWGAAQDLAYELVVVGFFQQLVDVLSRTGLPEEAAKRLVPELARDIFEGPQMIARPIGRGNQQKQQMHLVAVQAVKVHPFH